MSNNERGEPVSSQIRVAVQRLVARDGEQATADALGLSRNSLARVVGGLRVLRGTAALASRALEQSNHPPPRAA